MSTDPTISTPETPLVTGAAPAAPALGHRVASGFAWVGINTLASKFIGILVQLVLGWLLVPEDFGMVASVMAITALVNPIRVLNVSTFLTRRPAETERWTNAAVWLTSLTVLAGAVLLTLLAPVLAFRDEHPKVYLWCMAISIAATSIDALLVPFTGVMNGRMAFGFQTRVAVSVLTVQSVLSIALAMLHWGPFSILAPALLAAVCRLVLYTRAFPIRVHRTPETHLWKAMISEGLLLSLAQFAFLAISQTSYVGLNWFHGKYDTGLYYFAFTVAVQALFMVSSGLSAVLLPAMSQASTPEHRRSMYVTCCRLLLLITAPLCMMQTLAIAPAVQLVFGEKWAPAIGMAQVLSLGTLLRIVSFPSQSLFVAEGRLKLYAGWMISWSALFFATVMLSSWLGSPMMLTISVVAFFCLFDPLTGMLAFRLCGLSTRAAIGTVTGMHLVPLLGSAVAGAAVWYLQSRMALLNLGVRSTLLCQFALAFLVPILYLPVSMLLSREDSRRLLDVFDRLFLSRLPVRLTRAFRSKTA